MSNNKTLNNNSGPCASVCFLANSTFRACLRKVSGSEPGKSQDQNLRQAFRLITAAAAAAAGAFFDTAAVAAGASYTHSAAAGGGGSNHRL
jgi:hypothetical protein